MSQPSDAPPSKRLRSAAPRNTQPGAPPATHPIARRYVTKAWEVWLVPKDGPGPVESVRLSQQVRQSATLKPRRDIPRPRGC